MYTGPLNLKSGFPATQSVWTNCCPFSCNVSQQLLAFEHCSLKSNELFKDNVAAHSCSATKVTCLGCKDPKKRLNKKLVVGSKVLENILPLNSCQNSFSRATRFFFIIIIKNHFLMKHLTFLKLKCKIKKFSFTHKTEHVSQLFPMSL